MALSIEVATTPDGAPRLTLAGEIDLGTSQALREAVTTALRAKPPMVIVDLDAVTFLDSTGIAALINGRHLADAFAATYRVINIRDSVRWVLEIAGVLSYLDDEMAPAV